MEERVREAVLYSRYRSQRYHERRVRQLRRRIALLAATFVLLIAGFSYHTITSKAASEVGDVSYKYFTSIEVVYGDSLWSIAEKYAGEEYASINDYIKEVMKINHLKEDTLSAGQYLIVPYFTKEFK